MLKRMWISPENKKKYKFIALLTENEELEVYEIKQGEEK